MPLTVHILTTEGPVLIQSIAEEDPSIRSVVCVDGRAEALPISAAYDAFVRRPTGLIERLTGHGSYRMDVSSRVDDGRSWQLAAFIAHIAAAEDAGAGGVYATGELDRDGNVRPVDFVSRKLHLLEQAVTNGDTAPPTAILVPVGSVSEITEIAGVAVTEVAEVTDALSAAGLRLPVLAATSGKQAHSPVKRRCRAFFLAVLALGLVGVLWLRADLAPWMALANDGDLLALEEALGDATGVKGVEARLYAAWLDKQSPSPSAISLEGRITLAGESGDCAMGDHAVVALFEPLLAGARVCAVDIQAYSDDPDIVVVGRLAYWPSGLGNGGKPARMLRGSAEPSGRRWSLEPEIPPVPGSAIRLAVVAGAAEVSGAQPWYGDLTSMAADSVALTMAAQRLKRLGYAVKILDWRHP